MLMCAHLDVRAKRNGYTRCLDCGATGVDIIPKDLEDAYDSHDCKGESCQGCIEYFEAKGIDVDAQAEKQASYRPNTFGEFF